MKHALLAAVFALLAQSIHAQSDTAAYRAASEVSDATSKMHALEQFLEGYPGSAFKNGAYRLLFSLYLDQGNVASATSAASHYVELFGSDDSRIGPYNQFAYELATRNTGLDSALVFATRAEAMARAGGSSMLGAVEDTRAFVLYRLGEFVQAEQLQREAIRGHESDPEYVGHLALYEHGTGKRREALATLSRALYLGADVEMRSRFTEWISEEELESARAEALKDSLIMATVHAYVDTLSGQRAIEAKCSAAGLLAALSIELPTAQRWAEAAVATLTDQSSPDNVVSFKENLALVLVARGEDQQGLSLLRSIQQIVSPWENDYWLALGKTYEKIGSPQSAVEAYMQGLLVSSPKDLRQALEGAYAKAHGSTSGLDADLEATKKDGAAFDPGRYAPAGTPKGKVILAELFTGAECGPCVGSDVAFDRLGEYYPRPALAILEYHVHIPGPDPLTTNESWDRYRLYGGEGTPTVVIDGSEKMLGGGPRVVAHNRFNLYRYAIEKHTADKPAVLLSLSIANRHEEISVDAHLELAQGAAVPQGAALHVALVERSVDYTGGNGIARHAFVVRALSGGASGTPVAPTPRTQLIKQTFKLAEVESQIHKLLDDPRGQVSWPKRLKTFGAWRARPERIDRSNMAIVAWVQDMKTNAVLQAAYQDVPLAMSSR
ncbi:MAG TPA: hypothetical protein VEO56_11385 [Bacteroidota bacterium]|nr:hypothetical protein [Bacteroidota bacterium]